jgi:uncharacterized protein YdhG (YjbR/CyaY superfamily)
MAKRSVSAQSAPSAVSRVRSYLAALSPDARRALKTIRNTIRAAAPDAEEAFSYGIPGFRLDDRVLVWYAAWKAHTSMYPIGAAIRRRYAVELQRYETSTGTVRFPLDKPVPTAFVTRLVKSRVSEVRSGGRVSGTVHARKTQRSQSEA